MIVNPFGGELAVRNSRYFGSRNGRPVAVADADAGPDLFTSAVAGAFRGFVMNPEFTCVAARSAIQHEAYRLGVYDRLAGEDASAGLARDLYTFSRESESMAGPFATFAAAFREPVTNEVEFEGLLWAQLRALHRLDAPLHAWDPAVNSDPDDARFGFSFAGMAFFVVGLHAHSSRLARRFPWPTLVFNPHAQFERLKQEGGWRRMQEVIRAREVQLQGSINPVLTDFGEATEARQYSGRRVESDWSPPFPSEPRTPPDSPPRDASPAGRCPFGHSSPEGRRAG